MSSTVKIASDAFLEKKSEIDTLDPVIEVNESVAEQIFDRPYEEGEYEEISPRIFSLIDVKEPLTIESLNNAIYELGVVNLCWPEISEPVFETRTSFPKSYYTNSTKERLLLAYAENFRRQYNFYFKYKVRKPLLLQVPNECGLQKMVCTSIRPTKLCFADTSTWQGIAALASDYFDYEPLTKSMLHLEADMENFVKYKLIGGKLILKKGVLPHRFDCQRPPKKIIERPGYKKRQLIEYFERVLSKDIQHEDLQIHPIEFVECEKLNISVTDSDPLHIHEELNDNNRSHSTKAVQVKTKLKLKTKSTNTPNWKKGNR